MSKRKKRDYSQMLLWAATLVTVARYAGAFAASDVGELEGWVSDLITYSMIVTGFGMGVLDVIGGAYIFDGWRRALPRRGAKWSSRFRLLTVFVFGLILVGIGILIPFTVSRVLHTPISQVLPGWGIWVWAGMVNIAPYLLIGGVVMSQAGVVTVTTAASDRVETGQEPAKAKKRPDRAIGDRPVYASWPQVPATDRIKIQGMTGNEVATVYRVPARTARRWVEYAKDMEVGENGTKARAE